MVITLSVTSHTLQWRHMSVVVFRIICNFTVCSTSSSCKHKRIYQRSSLLSLWERKPPALMRCLSSFSEIRSSQHPISRLRDLAFYIHWEFNIQLNCSGTTPFIQYQVSSYFQQITQSFTKRQGYIKISECLNLNGTPNCIWNNNNNHKNKLTNKQKPIKCFYLSEPNIQLSAKDILIYLCKVNTQAISRFSPDQSRREH